MSRPVMIFGAGQAGRACRRLLGPQWDVTAFLDNDRSKSSILGIPVLPPEAACGGAERVVIAVANPQRARSMASQLEDLGYSGEITFFSDYQALFDVRAASARLLAEHMEADGVAGDIAEVGVFRGAFAAVLNGALPARTLHLFDTFEGFPGEQAALDREQGLSAAAAGDFADTSPQAVLSVLPHPEAAVIHQGVFPGTFAGLEQAHFCLVSLDADLYQPTLDALELFWPRLSAGGAVLLHDFNSAQYGGAGSAARAFCAERGIVPVPLGDLHGTAVLVKQGAQP